MSSRRLLGKSVILTGAAGLIGRQLASALAEAGANLYLVDRDRQRMDAVYRELLDAHPGVSIRCSYIDVTSADQIRSLLHLLGDEGVDVLINCAAVNDVFKHDACEESKFENYALDMWNAGINANLTSVFLMTQIVGTKMRERGGGHIVNVSSTYGLVAPDQALYTDEDGEQLFYKSASYPVAKAGVIALTKYCAAYWGRSNVRVNALVPGGVEDGQDAVFVKKYEDRTPLGRMAQATDYNGAVVFLASDESRYMTGSVLVVDGGWTVC